MSHTELTAVEAENLVQGIRDVLVESDWARDVVRRFRKMPKTRRPKFVARFVEWSKSLDKAWAESRRWGAEYLWEVRVELTGGQKVTQSQVYYTAAYLILQLES